MYRVKIWLGETLVGAEYILDSFAVSGILVVKLIFHFLLLGVVLAVVIGDTVLPMMGRVGLKKLRWVLLASVARLAIVAITGTNDLLGLAAFSVIASVWYHGWVLWWMLELGKTKYADIRFVCLRE